MMVMMLLMMVMATVMTIVMLILMQLLFLVLLMMMSKLMQYDHEKHHDANSTARPHRSASWSARASPWIKEKSSRHCSPSLGTQCVGARCV